MSDVTSNPFLNGPKAPLAETNPGLLQILEHEMVVQDEIEASQQLPYFQIPLQKLAGDRDSFSFMAFPVP